MPYLSDFKRQISKSPFFFVVRRNNWYITLLYLLDSICCTDDIETFTLFSLAFQCHSSYPKCCLCFIFKAQKAFLWCPECCWVGMGLNGSSTLTVLEFIIKHGFKFRMWACKVDSKVACYEKQRKAECIVTLFFFVNLKPSDISRCDCVAY